MSEKQSFTGWLLENSEKYATRDELVKAVVKYRKGTRNEAQKRISDLVRRGRLDGAAFGGARYQERAQRISAVETGEDSGVREESRPEEANPRKKAVKVPSKFKLGIEVSVVKKEYDDEGKIEAGLVNLGTQVIKDNDFRTELGVSTDRWKVVSGLKKFEKHRIELRGKQYKGVYWGQVEVIKELRRAVDML